MILKTMWNHKIEVGGIAGSGYHLTGADRAPPIESLKQIPFLDTGLSIAVCVEIFAAFCVICLFVKYVYGFYCWVRERYGRKS